MLLTILNGRLFGCPHAKDHWNSAEGRAQNAATNAKNSKFALAVIQTLLDTSVNNYHSVLSVTNSLCFSSSPRGIHCFLSI